MLKLVDHIPHALQLVAHPLLEVRSLLPLPQLDALCKLLSLLSLQHFIILGQLQEGLQALLLLNNTHCHCWNI